MNQIPLTSQEEVQIIEGPPDADFSEVHRVLSQDNPSIRELASLKIRGIIPMRFKTNQSVDGKEPATLELLPQSVEPLPGGKGWSWRGQSTNASAFRKRGNRKTAPITEGTGGRAAEQDCFNVV